jgi:tRNA(Arg) A34 adenosine deaminase TadA
MNDSYMKEVIRRSHYHMQAGEGGSSGAVVVKNRQIIGRGWN